MARKLQMLMDAKQKGDDSRRELIAGISHDLRTPLISIKGYAEGLVKGIAATPSMQKEYLQTIADKTADLEHIVNQLFLFSKLDTEDFPLSLETVDIGSLLMQYAETVSAEYNQRGLHIALGNIKEKAIVRVDIVQLRNVFTTLLENSVKYGAKEQGIVKIECTIVGADVHIVFHDNGPDVSDDKLEKLFNAFFRTDKARSNPGHGSGLGLAISRRIVELTGSSIWAENDKGLKVTIALPTIQGGSNEKDTDY